MKFVQWDQKEWLHKEWYSKKIYLNEDDLHAPWTLVQQLSLPAGQRAEIHYHKLQTEIFYFFDDTGYRIVNGEEIHPKAWDVLIIEPNDRYTVVNQTNKEYIYVCFKLNYPVHGANDFYRD